MGVPDESDGPVRKRPRLSLHTAHKPDRSKPISETCSAEMTSENTTEVNQSSALVKSLDCIDLTADLPSFSDPVVAPVASLHNLGNTCFLNSMLEVLRYTPGFLNGLSRLQDEIVTAESKCDMKSADSGSSGVNLGWQVVKNTYAMYKEMDKKEEQYREIATSDASSMAVRPIVLLDNIRELNPMFEGHFQHDAQELLRCLLCYIEDAEKEVMPFRESSRIQLEDNNAVTKSDAKPAQHNSPCGSGKILMEMIERGNTSNNDRVSLKGGEGQGRGKIIRQGRRRFHGLGQNACLKNIIDGKKKTTDSASLLNDKVMIESQYTNADEINASDHTLSTVAKQQKETGSDLQKLSPLRASKNRKRKRSRSKSATINKLTDVVNNFEEITCVAISCGLKKAACLDTCDNSIISGKPKRDRSKITEETCNEASVFSEFSAPTAFDLSEVQAASSLGSSFSQNKLASESDVITGTSASSETGSPKPSISTVLPHNQIKRLGMRGRVIFDSVNKTHLNTVGSGCTQEYSDGDNNNNGDVNNNGSYINNNDSKSRLGEENINTVLSKSSHEEMYSRKLTPEFVGKCVSSEVMDTPTKTVILSPAKSPIVPEHLNDEISRVFENDMSHVDSAIDSVTKKYFSSLSQSESKATLVHLCSSSSSYMSSAGHGLVAEAPDDIFSSAVQSSVQAPARVLEPNSEINVTVVFSPKKDAQLLFSNTKSEFLMSSDDKIHLASDDRSKNLLPSTSTYVSCMQGKKERETTVQPELSLEEKLSQDSKNKFPETLRTSNNFTASCNSLCDRLLSRPIYNSSTSQAKLNQSDCLSSSVFSSKNTISAQRSPGANGCFNLNSLQPKLELKKCDWLGVSPVKSVSAVAAMLFLERKRMLQNSTSVKRKILSADSENKSQTVCSSSAGENHVQSDLSCPLLCQNFESENMDCLSSKTNYESEEKNISNSTASALPHSKATQNETKMKNSQTSILTFTQKLPRTRRQGTKLSEPVSHTPVKVAKSNSVLLGKDVCLKSLSVTLDNCDWFLKAKLGQTVSARQAMIEIKKGQKITLKSYKFKTGASDLKSQSKAEKTERVDELSTYAFPDMKNQTSHITLIERLFGGTMMHQTKCLECEVARQRQEVFMDISVPVRSLHSGNNSDDDTDDDNPDSDRGTKDTPGNSCLSKLMQALSQVERLKDTNKYFCDQCLHYVEAERSCHYLTLPAILTLHLKRFSANSRLFGGVSKIIDKVAIPENLPCLQYHCKTQCLDASHRYSLFAIVTHSGTSILHGHYRAYVKVQSQVNPSVFGNLVKSEVKADTNQHLGEKTNITSPHVESVEPYHWDDDENYSVECAADFDANSRPDKINQKLNVELSDNTSTVPGNVTDVVKAELLTKHSEVDKTPDLGQARTNEVKSEHASQCESGSFWLECDDECIKVMDEAEFADKLEEKDGCLIGTPYVLFYHKLLA